MLPKQSRVSITNALQASTLKDKVVFNIADMAKPLTHHWGPRKNSVAHDFNVVVVQVNDEGSHAAWPA